jgi:outer membrane protein assembly factor BamB
MNKIILFLFCTFNIYGQNQVTIPWSSLADSPWPFIRGDMQCTGRSEFIGPSTNNVLWRKDMPLGINPGPSIGYTDILFMGTEAISPDSVNYFYAVDKNGQDLWTFETESYFANFYAPLITRDSVIYFGSRNRKIYSLYPNGELKWQVENIYWGWRHGYMTLAKNGDLYAPSWDTLLVIDKYGTIKEKRTIEELFGRPFVFSTGGDTTFYFTGGGDNSNPGALNAANLNGDVLWSYEFATHNLGAPLVDNSNKIYVFGTDSVAARNCFIYCIKPDGTMDWRYKVDDYERYSAPTIDKNGNIIFHAISYGNPESENFIVSLDYFGNENWKTVLPGDFGSSLIDHGLVCDADGKIYCGSTFGGFVYCLSSQGEVLWTIDLGEYEYDSSPAIGSDGTLYIGTHMGSLFQNNEQNLIAIRDSVTSVEKDDAEVLSYILEQNFPNPFNPSTTIKYSFPKSGEVAIDVYDALGRKVKTLVEGFKQSGSYEITFNAKDLSSGVYIYRLTATKNGRILFTDSKQMILLR